MYFLTLDFFNSLAKHVPEWEDRMIDVDMFLEDYGFKDEDGELYLEEIYDEDDSHVEDFSREVWGDGYYEPLTSKIEVPEVFEGKAIWYLPSSTCYETIDNAIYPGEYCISNYRDRQYLIVPLDIPGLYYVEYGVTEDPLTIQGGYAYDMVYISVCRIEDGKFIPEETKTVFECDIRDLDDVQTPSPVLDETVKYAVVDTYQYKLPTRVYLADKRDTAGRYSWVTGKEMISNHTSCHYSDVADFIFFRSSECQNNPDFEFKKDISMDEMYAYLAEKRK